MKTMTVYDYQTGEELGELSGLLLEDYIHEASINDPDDSTGAVNGAHYGYPGLTIYALTS